MLIVNHSGMGGWFKMVVTPQSQQFSWWTTRVIADQSIRGCLGLIFWPMPVNDVHLCCQPPHLLGITLKKWDNWVNAVEFQGSEVTSKALSRVFVAVVQKCYQLALEEMSCSAESKFF